MKITAPLSALDAMVKAALPFTAPPANNASTVDAFRTWLLLEADAEENTLTVTAEAANAAIRFDVEGVEVKASGRMAVVAQSLRTLLSVIPAESVVDIVLNDDNSVRFTADATDATLTVAPLSSRVQVPAIGVIDGRTKVTMSSEDFVRAYTLGSASRDQLGETPNFLGIHFSGAGDRARFMSFNGKTASYAGVDVKLSDGEFAVMLDDKVTRSMLDYVRAGSNVEIIVSESGRFLHVFVTDDAGRELYLLRGATVEFPADRYNADQILGLIQRNVKMSQTQLVVDKSQTLKLFTNAERVSTIGGRTGAERPIEVSVDKGHFRVKVQGDSSYRNEIAVTSFTGEPIEFFYHWGLYGTQLGLYPDSSQLRIAMLHKDDGTPLAFLLHTDKWSADSEELPDDYLCLIPLKAKS